MPLVCTARAYAASHSYFTQPFGALYQEACDILLRLPSLLGPNHTGKFSPLPAWNRAAACRTASPMPRACTNPAFKPASLANEPRLLVSSAALAANAAAHLAGGQTVLVQQKFIMANYIVSLIFHLQGCGAYAIKLCAYLPCHPRADGVCA